MKLVNIKTREEIIEPEEGFDIMKFDLGRGFYYTPSNLKKFIREQEIRTNKTQYELFEQALSNPPFNVSKNVEA
jgi:hypothetical protein